MVAKAALDALSALAVSGMHDARSGEETRGAPRPLTRERAKRVWRTTSTLPEAGPEMMGEIRREPLERAIRDESSPPDRRVDWMFVPRATSRAILRHARGVLL